MKIYSAVPRVLWEGEYGAMGERWRLVVATNGHVYPEVRLYDTLGKFIWSGEKRAPENLFEQALVDLSNATQAVLAALIPTGTTVVWDCKEENAYAAEGVAVIPPYYTEQGELVVQLDTRHVVPLKSVLKTRKPGSGSR